MTTRILTEVEAAAFLSCRTFKEARRTLQSIPPRARLADGPRWTETQLLEHLGERVPGRRDPSADELAALAALDRA